MVLVELVVVVLFADDLGRVPEFEQVSELAPMADRQYKRRAAPDGTLAQ